MHNESRMRKRIVMMQDLVFYRPQV